MFQFTPFPSHALCIHAWIPAHYYRWVPPFGNLRVNGYVLLTAAYRSLSRPSSAPSAKASALCSFSLDLLLVISSIARKNYFAVPSRLLLVLVVKISGFSVNRSISCKCFHSLSFANISTWLTSNTRFVFDFCFTQILFSFQCSYKLFKRAYGGLGRTRTSDLTLIRRAL